MSKKIIASITILLILITSIAPIFATDKEMLFVVNEIEEFQDPKVDNLTLIEIEELIKEQRIKQENAHQIAELARQLNWPENSETIINAKTEWRNAFKAINYYNKICQERLDLIAQKWDRRAKEYPIATDIWLIFSKQFGWSDEICAGILGNIMTEVGGYTLDIQPYLGKSYYGICQWNVNYYPNIVRQDYKQQCYFLRDTIKDEFDNFGYAYGNDFNFDSFIKMTDVREIALAFAKCYERCGPKSYNIRQNNAETAYNYFTK